MNTMDEDSHDEEYPQEDLMEHLGIEIDPNRNNLFDYYYNLCQKERYVILDEKHPVDQQGGVLVGRQGCVLVGRQGCVLVEIIISVYINQEIRGELWSKVA